MKLTKVILLLFYFLHWNQAGAQKNDSPQVLGKVVFEALVKKDSLLFEKAKASESELKYAYHRMMKKMNKEVNDEEVKKVYSMYSKNAMKSFSETISEGENDGIIWSEIDYLKTVFIERSDSDPELIEIGKTQLEFEFNGKIYIVKIGDSINLKGNWTIEDSIYWEGEKGLQD